MKGKLILAIVAVLIITAFIVMMCLLSSSSINLKCYYVCTVFLTAKSG